MFSHDMQAPLRPAIVEGGAETQQGSLPRVSVDRDQISRVFLNLIGNSLVLGLYS